MPMLTILTNGDGAWPDLVEKRAAGLLLDAMGEAGARIALAPLPGGMESGATSVSIRIDLPDGRVVLTETSLALLKSAVQAFEAIPRAH